MEISEINQEIIKIWDEYYVDNPDSLTWIKPFLFSEKTKFNSEGLLFVGGNPSFYEGNDERLLYKNKNSDYSYWLEKAAINRNNMFSDFKNGYFGNFIKISNRLNKIRWDHIDLFYYQRTSQSSVKKIYFKDSTMKEFFKKQINLFPYLIELIKPKIIIVANAFASDILHANFSIDILEDKYFNNDIGTYIIKNENSLIPIFFNSMLSRGATAKGSFKRLVWHIDFVLKKLPLLPSEKIEYLELNLLTY